MSVQGAQVMGDEAIVKKKPRKGTTSCIECKKRKTRCFFSSAADATCVGCQRRGTSCRSQEFDEDVPISDESLSVRARLIRVETLLGKIMERVVPEEAERRGLQLVEQIQVDTSSPGSQSSINGSETISHRSRSAVDSRRESPHAPSYSKPFRPSSESQPTLHGNKYGGLAQTLHEALPPQQVVDLLIGNGRAAIYLQVLCNPYSDVFSGNLQASSDLTTLPNISSHPVLIARKLLQLAVCIQQLDPSFDDSSLDLMVSLEKCMAKYVDLASSLVTTNEKLIDSLEGMECLILEGVYLINSGNLRRAWMCFRRAMSLAQFMGLQKGTPKVLKILDQNTKASCPIIWFRIVYAERYLSLLLGVPSGISDNNFASVENMQGATSTERLDRVHPVVCSQVIQRNEMQAYHDFTTTSKIDFDLQSAARSIDAKWWFPPNLNPGMSLSELMADVIRAQTQIIHHNLLILLHLPFMLRDASERRYDYSKTACVYASREILSRWITFRGFVRVVFCCRWVDFCAFTAALTLLLAHIDSHTNSAGYQMQHRRLADRALVEMALDTMDELNRVNGDLLTKHTAELARKLLEIELDASKQTSIYNAKAVDDENTEEGLQSYSLLLKIPYFGTVSISHEGRFPRQPHSLADTSSFSDISNTPPTFTPSSFLPSSTESFNSFGGLGAMAANNWQSTTGHEGTSQTQTHGFSAPLVGFQEDFGSQNIIMTDLVAGEDEWSFQGVDATFFDAVLKSNTANPGSWDQSWTDWDTMF